MIRDPLTDPAEGDIVTNGATDLLVHFVERGRVYGVRFRAHETGQGVGEAVQISLDGWRMACGFADARVLAVGLSPRIEAPLSTPSRKGPS